VTSEVGTKIFFPEFPPPPPDVNATLYGDRLSQDAC